MKCWTHPRPGGAHLRASVASLMLGIFLFDRETRTAKFQSADNFGRSGGVFPSSFLTREEQSDIFLSNLTHFACKFLKACYIYNI